MFKKIWASIDGYMSGLKWTAVAFIGFIAIAIGIGIFLATISAVFGGK